MRRSEVALLLVGLLFLLAAAWWAMQPKDYMELPMHLTVGANATVGINIDNTSLEMGRAPPLAMLQRQVRVGNGATDPRRVSATALGDLASWTKVSGPFVVGPGEVGLLNVTVTIPADAAPRELTGVLRIFLSPI
jgi:hypothetical protein